MDADAQEAASWDAVGFYSIAEKYCLPELQDIIMDTLLKYHKIRNELPSGEFAIRAYEQASAGSSLANYCTRAMAYIVGTDRKDNELQENWPTSDIARLNRELPNFAEALLRVQREMAQDLGVSDPRLMRSCGFYAHTFLDYCAANLIVRFFARRERRWTARNLIETEDHEWRHRNWNRRQCISISCKRKGGPVC